MSLALFNLLRPALGAWQGPDDIPYATVPEPVRIGSDVPLSVAARHLILAWNQVSAFFDNVDLKASKQRNMSILRNTGKADGLEATVQAWLNIDASPSPLLWFFWCRGSNSARSMQGAVGMAMQVWTRKEYWDTFGNKYQVSRKLWSASAVDWAARWKRGLDTALSHRGDEVALVASMEEAFGPGFRDADVLAEQVFADTDALQSRVDRAAEGLVPGLWMWDWPPRYKVRGACDTLGI